MLGEEEEVKGLQSRGQAVILKHMSCATGYAIEKVLFVLVFLRWGKQTDYVRTRNVKIN